VTGLFADITLGAVIVIGLLMIGGVLFVANVNDPRNALHPNGRMGRLRDELLVVSTIAPFLVMVTGGAVLPSLREANWWMPVFFVVAVTGLAASFLVPPVRRARQRVEALRKTAFS
jgi:hypothetical protein